MPTVLACPSVRAAVHALALAHATHRGHAGVKFNGVAGDLWRRQQLPEDEEPKGLIVCKLHQHACSVRGDGKQVPPWQLEGRPGHVWSVRRVRMRVQKIAFQRIRVLLCVRPPGQR